MVGSARSTILYQQQVCSQYPPSQDLHWRRVNYFFRFPHSFSREMHLQERYDGRPCIVCIMSRVVLPGVWSRSDQISDWWEAANISASRAAPPWLAVGGEKVAAVNRPNLMQFDSAPINHAMSRWLTSHRSSSTVMREVWNDTFYLRPFAC